MLRLVALETRLLFREWLAWIVLAVASLACIGAAAQGEALVDGLDAGRQAYLAERAQVDEALLKSINESDPAKALLLPRSVGLPIIAAPPPLADFTIGRARFEEYTSTARLGVREGSMFKRARFDNPDLLARGGIDLSFVAVVIMPLLLIALGYGVFASDRDSGVARLVLVQQASQLRLVTVRGIPRLIIVALPLALTAVVLLAVGPDLPGRAGAAAWWLLLALLLLLFWWAMILFVNSFRLGAESAALLLVALWAIFTLVLPALVAATALAANPPPSRFEQIAVGRAAEIRATSQFINDHPELTDEVAERVRQARGAVKIDDDIEAALRPLDAAFEEQRRRQQQTVRLLSLLSPASMTMDGQAAVAGTDSRAGLDFRSAARSYLAQVKRLLGEALMSNRPLTETAWRALPRFNWTASASHPLSPVLYLALLAVLVGLLAILRFRRAELV